MAKTKRGNPQTHTRLRDGSRGFSRGGGTGVGFLSQLFPVPRPPFKVFKLPHEPDGDLQFLYDEGKHSENWVEGFSEGTNSQQKEFRNLLVCSGPDFLQSQSTWETTQSYDFSTIDEVWVLWENTGSDSIDNYSLMTIGDQGTSALEGHLIFFQEGTLEKQWVVIDVSDFKGSGYLRVHSMAQGSDVESCVEISKVALVFAVGAGDLDPVDACAAFGLPEGEEVAWLIMAEDQPEGVNKPVSPQCAEENFIMGVTKNNFIDPVWLAESREEGQHSTLIGGWGLSAIITKHNNWVYPTLVADDLTEGEDATIVWGENEVIVTDNSNLT